MKEYGSVLHRPQTAEFHRTAISKIIRIMREDPGASLDWNELSRIACISRFHFLRIFEELTNTTPHRFLVALRMERAKRLLFDTALSINDIGLRAGYRSAGTFVRVFKSLVGLTPGKLRQFRAHLSNSELQQLLESGSDDPTQVNPLPHFTVDLRAPGPFTGIVCVGNFTSSSLHGGSFRGAIARQTQPIQLGLAETASINRVCAIGFREPAEANNYFLPEADAIFVGSTRLTNTHSGTEESKNIILTMDRPTLFEPPVLVCLPLLLLKISNRMPPALVDEPQHNLSNPVANPAFTPHHYHSAAAN